MNTDDFEQRLQRQPLRQPPASWREQILAAAHAALEGRAGAPSPAARATLEGKGGVPLPAAGGGRGTARPIWLRWFKAAEPDREAPVRSSASLRRRLQDWLWPHPVAWGALAACWATVALLNSAADAPLIASVRLTAGSTSALALQAADWGDAAGPAFAPLTTPPARRPSPKSPSPTSSSIRHHETQAA